MRTNAPEEYQVDGGAPALLGSVVLVGPAAKSSKSDDFAAAFRYRAQYVIEMYIPVMRFTRRVNHFCLFSWQLYSQ